MIDLLRDQIITVHPLGTVIHPTVTNYFNKNRQPHGQSINHKLFRHFTKLEEKFEDHL